MLAGFLLLAGEVQKLVRRAETHETALQFGMIGLPFGHGATETAEDAMFLQRGDDFEGRKDLMEAFLIQRLQSGKTDHTSRNALRSQFFRRSHSFGRRSDCGCGSRRR